MLQGLGLELGLELGLGLRLGLGLGLWEGVNRFFLAKLIYSDDIFRRKDLIFTSKNTKKYIEY